MRAWEKTFEHPDDFEATHAAEAWLRDRGYSLGEMQGDAPRLIMKGDLVIMKWRNISAAERARGDGTLEGGPRKGPVTIRLREAPAVPDLKPHQWAALESLARDPAAYVVAGTLSKLRKMGLVGKVVKRSGPTQKTTSPVTNAGRAALADRTS